MVSDLKILENTLNMMVIRCIRLTSLIKEKWWGYTKEDDHGGDIVTYV